MAIVASGQLTLTDLNDAKQLAMYIGASQSRTVIFNGVSTYTPNYSTSNQILTPQLFIAGDNTDQIANAVAIRWFYQSNGTGVPTAITVDTADFVLAPTGVKTLTIKSNIMSSRTSMTIICEIDFTDPDTGFVVTTKAEIEIVKVTNGINGTNGQDALVGVLSNDSSVIATNSDGSGGSYAGATTTMSIYVGSSDDSANWTVTATPSSGVTGSLSGKTYSVTAMSADTGYVDLVATRSGYSSVTRRFSLSKSKGGGVGQDGQNATSYWLVTSTSAIQKSKTSVYTPSSITVTAKSQTGTSIPANYSGRFIISDSTDGTTFTARYTSSVNETTKAYTPSADIKALKVQMYLAGGTSTLLDEQIIPIVTDGTDGTNGNDAIIGVLSNESITLPANSSGTVTSYTGAVSTLTIYKGATDDTANWTIAQTKSTGVTVTEATTSKTATVTAVTQDVSTVTFTATRSGYSNIVKVFTITKAKAGTNGTSPTAYNMYSSANVLTLNNTRTAYNPTSITFTSKSQTGTGAIGNYSGRFKIYESTDGITFNLKYTSSADESSKAYTPTAYNASSNTVKAVKAELYLAGGTTTEVDELTVNVVADGTNSVYANVWTPEGNTVKNDSGTVKAQVDLYNGTDEVTATTYKWYIQDPTATVASGGDADGGEGWRLLNAGYTAGTSGYATKTLTIPASAIAGTEAFKGIGIYNGTNYGGVTTVVDLSDPIMVRLDGMDKFKNGEGSVTVRATLIRAGVEIDSAGTGYTYTWSVYDSSNVKTAFAKTGKSITVDATDIDGRGNLVCDVTD